MLCSIRATEAGRKSRTNDLWRCCSPASFLTSPVVDSHGRRGPPLLTAVSSLLWCMLPVFAAVCIRKTTGPRRGMRWWWPRCGPPVNYCRTLFFEEDSERKHSRNESVWFANLIVAWEQISAREIKHKIIGRTILFASTSYLSPDRFN